MTFHDSLPSASVLHYNTTLGHQLVLPEMQNFIDAPHGFYDYLYFTKNWQTSDGRKFRFLEL